MKIYKQIIIIILIILFVITLENMTNKITKKSINDINMKIDKLQNYIETEKDNIEKEVGVLEEEWKNREKKLSYYLEHDELEKVSLNMAILKKQIKIQDFEHAQETIAEVKFMLEHIEEKPKLKIENIF